MTWGDILKAIGPNFMSPSGPAMISVALGKNWKENRGRTSASTLADGDIALIKNQFIALGYMHSYNAKAVNGGIQEFLELTKAGRMKLSELLAVRTATAHA